MNELILIKPNYDKIWLEVETYPNVATIINHPKNNKIHTHHPCNLKIQNVVNISAEVFPIFFSANQVQKSCVSIHSKVASVAQSWTIWSDINYLLLGNKGIFIIQSVNHRIYLLNNDW